MKYTYFKTIWVVFTCLIFGNVFFIGEAFASDDVSVNIDKQILQTYQNSLSTQTFTDTDSNLEESSGMNDSLTYNNQDTDMVSIVDPMIPAGNSFVSQSAESAAQYYGINDDSLLVNDEEYYSTNYSDKHYEDKLHKNGTYIISQRDMITRDILTVDEVSNFKTYTTIAKGESVVIQGFANTDEGYYVILKTSDGNIHYENPEDFYKNTVYNQDSKFVKSIKVIWINAVKAGTEKGFFTCLFISIFFIITTILMLNFFDTSIFRLSNYEKPTLPYLNGSFRIMPGAMLGCFLTIINLFDKNAIAYYLYYGFSIVGKGFRVSHWIIHAVLFFSLLIFFKIIVESCKCFAGPCVVVRIILIAFANLGVFYLFNALSFIGIAIYVLFVVYQSVFYQTILSNENVAEEPHPQTV